MNARILPILFALSAIPGCSHVDVSPAVSQTDIRLSSQTHWLEQPANASVTHDNYDELWQACIESARFRGYQPARMNYRDGVLVTLPVTGKQFFEVWKRDTPAVSDIVENSLTSTRRIIRFEIARREDGTFECVPKVLVELFAGMETRVTSVTRYRDAFQIEPNQGSRERDKGNNIPDAYWYTTGRDDVLEKELAKAVQSRLRGAIAKR